MKKIVECVPNFSEGRDKSIIEAIAAAIRTVDKVKLLNVDPGEDFNRTVYTFVGEPEQILKAAFKSAKIGLSLIDMTKHKGEHARMGALDVIPFIPIKNVTMSECIELSKQFGKKMAEELEVPVFLYANSAKKPERIRLPDIRKGEYEELKNKFKDPKFKPDYGKPVFIPKSGVTATGAREILIAYNINLNTNDKSIANKISGKLRTSGVIQRDEKGEKIIGQDGKPKRIPGKFKDLQAGGMMYNENIAQVSMNLLNFHNVNLHNVYEAAKEEAEKLDIKVTGSEIVGLVPKEALVKAGKFYIEKTSEKIPKNEEELVVKAVEKLGLSQLYPFKPEEKIIEYIVEESGPLVSLKIKDFLSELSSSSPAPGGGSVAALSGAIGTALSSMVCNLTIGKDKYSDVQTVIKDNLIKSENLRKKLIKLIDKDTEAFNDVIKAFKMPKDTIEQKEKRINAIQDGYKTATRIPLETAKTCEKILDIAMIISTKGNQNSITDAGVSALMAQTGIQSAILNVRINLSSIKDEKYVKSIISEIENLQNNSIKKTNKIMKIIENKL